MPSAVDNEQREMWTNPQDELWSVRAWEQGTQNLMIWNSNMHGRDRLLCDYQNYEEELILESWLWFLKKKRKPQTENHVGAKRSKTDSLEFRPGFTKFDMTVFTLVVFEGPKRAQINLGGSERLLYMHCEAEVWGGLSKTNRVRQTSNITVKTWQEETGFFVIPRA